MLDHLVVANILGLPSPGDMVKDMLNAIADFFSVDAHDGVEYAIKALTHLPPADFTADSFRHVYAGSWALALILGSAGMLLRITRSLVVREYGGMARALLDLPLVMLVGSAIPFVAYSLQGTIAGFNSGMVKFIIGKSPEVDNFSILDMPGLGGANGLFFGLISYAEAFMLQMEAIILTELLPIAAILVMVTFGMRWLGFLGDSLFRIALGLAFVSLLSSTFMLFMLALYEWASGILQLADDKMAANLLGVTALGLSGLVPLVLLFVYSKSISQKVNGLMSGRSVGLANGQTVATGSSSGFVSRATLAGGSALVGAVIASQNDPRPPDRSRMNHIREMGSQKANLKAAAIASTNPVAAAGLLAGSQLIKPRAKKPDGDSHSRVSPPV